MDLYLDIRTEVFLDLLYDFEGNIETRNGKCGVVVSCQDVYVEYNHLAEVDTHLKQITHPLLV